MAGKKGSTSYTASGSAATEADAGWTPVRAGGSGEKDESARSEEAPAGHVEALRDTPHQPASRQSALERQSIMVSQRPSHDRKVPRGMLDRSLQAQLGRQLRSIYSDIASEPVPERFIKLLEELEAREERR
jgi:hypothetical protein